MISQATTLEELVRASTLLTEEMDFKSLIAIFVEQSIDITHSDSAAFYLFTNPEQTRSDLSLLYKRGRYEVPQRIAPNSELIEFLLDCRESVVLLQRKTSPFEEILLSPPMESGIALPVFTPKVRIGVLFLNSLYPDFYNRERFNFLDSFNKLGSGMLHNSQMFRELREYLRKIEELQRYQESIFSSMTNLLIATDNQGGIHYFNRAAQESLHLSDEDVGRDLKEVFRKALTRKVFNSLEKVKDNGQEILGIEGIFKREEADIDFSLNVSPLRGKRGRHEGLTLLFTDQTKEQELKEKMTVAVEERRIIKDMFSRYLSQEVVKNLMEAPELVRPGGDKKKATVFFADIRGYTSFSEGKEPEYIIEILNEYFGEAVEVVVKYGGYIDKFIGDCIMAAWGVPLVSEEEDAVNAVSCALEIQQLVASKKRSFFRGKASSLKIGIGMHTGPLVAGNLGSSRRMDYSVIGDTVNVAARLEGVAEADEVIITQDTRDFLGDLFKLEKRKAVRVKGKEKPLQIYNVLERAS